MVLLRKPTVVMCWLIFIFNGTGNRSLCMFNSMIQKKILTKDEKLTVTLETLAQRLGS